MAMDWIMREAARVSDLSFRPEQPMVTSFNEGRRYVGVLIRYMLEPAILVQAKAHDAEVAKKERQK